MNLPFLSKSMYCDCIQCEKILWMDRHRRECSAKGQSESALEEGRKVGELARGLFGEYVEVAYEGGTEARVKRTSELLKHGPNVIAEASFSFENKFCSVDILKNDADGVEIYEVKASTHVDEIHLEDLAYQYFVLSCLGFNIKRACIVYLNNKYVREGELDLDGLFRIEDATEFCIDNMEKVVVLVDMIEDFIGMHGASEEPDVAISERCFSPRQCRYWDYCTRDLPRPNVFDIAGMYKKTKFELFNEGKVSFEDLQNEDLRPKYLEQIDFELNNREPKVNMEAIQDILDSLKYPLYFIDYETFRSPIPEIEGTKPYQQIPFQYSLHIIAHEGAEVEHREFLAEADDEDIIRSFAESMIADMPEDGSVIIYNNSFEPARNREIAGMCPDLASEMERINANMVDFMVPFRDRNYYVREMQGSHSIKMVLPALYPDDLDLDYAGLPGVHNGGEASEAFVALKDMTPEEQEMTREGLLRYCELDTLAMVKIWERFREIVE